MTELFLCHYSWNAGLAEGETLPEVVRTIREKLESEDHTACSQFDNSLIQAGYLDSQSHLYEERRLQELSEKVFEVRDGFPRLRPGDVPSGILDCRYTVELSSCSDFEVRGDQLDQMFSGGTP